MQIYHVNAENKLGIFYLLKMLYINLNVEENMQIKRKYVEISIYYAYYESVEVLKC